MGIEVLITVAVVVLSLLLLVFAGLIIYSSILRERLEDQRSSIFDVAEGGLTMSNGLVDDLLWVANEVQESDPALRRIILERLRTTREVHNERLRKLIAIAERIGQADQIILKPIEEIPSDDPS